MFKFFKLPKEELIVGKKETNAIIEFERQYLCLDYVSSRWVYLLQAKVIMRLFPYSWPRGTVHPQPPADRNNSGH